MNKKLVVNEQWHCGYSSRFISDPNMNTSAKIHKIYKWHMNIAILRDDFICYEDRTSSKMYHIGIREA